MKKIFKYIIIASVGLSFSSCKKFLEKEPIAQSPQGEFFNNQQNAQTAVIGMYRTLLSPYSYGEATVIVPEFSANHVNHSGGYAEFVNFTSNTVRIDNPWTTNIWNATYATINAANLIATRVPQMPQNAITDDLRKQFTLESKFIRALSYFTLVRSFGDVPLITTPTEESTDLKVSRTPLNDVYTQIISDLTDASELPNTYASTPETKGRATGYAAKALLSKVYLYHASISNNTGDYTQSAKLAKEVIDGGFSLSTVFSDVWVKENTPESIFELQFDAQATNTLGSVSNPSPSMLFYAKGDTIIKMYTAADKRRDFTVHKNAADAQDIKYYIGKYSQSTIQNFPVIRLAEVLLIHAEAQARVDGTVSAAAYGSYKAVRDRAGLTTPDITTFTSVDDFVTAIQHEKRLELMFEGEAWFDYCRTGLALTEMMAIKDRKFFLYPIPQADRQINPNLTQNPGY